MICYLPATQEVRVFRYPVINDNYVSAIGEDKYGNLFIGTQKHGLSRYDREQNRFIPVPYTGSEELSIYCLTLVDDRLLIGTDGQGLKTYNRMTGKIEDYSINSAPLDFFGRKDTRYHGRPGQEPVGRIVSERYCTDAQAGESV